jgi:DNA-binding NarL/FixJ family response regulator
LKTVFSDEVRYVVYRTYVDTGEVNALQMLEMMPMSGQILIVDDSSTMRSNLKKLLESHSNRWKVCAEAADGLEAVQKALASKPDLIIMDFQMPLVDGLIASARIAKSLPHVPILIFTIHKSAYIEKEAKEAGVRAVILKTNPAALLTRVEGILGGNPNPGRPD